MTEFIYNNAKNTSFSHTPFELYCGYYFQMLYKNNINPCSKSKLGDKLLAELKELIIVYRKKLHYILKFLKF